MWIEAAKGLRVCSKSVGEFRLQPGHPTEVPDHVGRSLITTVPEKVRVVTAPPLGPIPAVVRPPTSISAPIQPGWVITYRDAQGRSQGGADARQDGTVRSCHRIGAQWVVELTTGTRVGEAQIVGVASVSPQGKVLAAWTVQEHGLSGREQRGASPAYRVGEMVTVRSLNGEIWIGQVMVHEYEPTGQGTRPGHWYCVADRAKEAWVHESLLCKKGEGERNTRGAN